MTVTVHSIDHWPSRGGDVRETQRIILDGDVGSTGATVRWAIGCEAKTTAEAAEAVDEAEAD